MLRRIPIPLAVSLLAILLAASVILVQIPPVLSALLGSGGDGDDPNDVIAGFVERHDKNQQKDRDRFVGRYLFYAMHRRVGL